VAGEYRLGEMFVRQIMQESGSERFPDGPQFGGGL
jgi:hypothetical protein